MMAEDKKEESSEMQGLAVKMLQARTLVISQGVTSELTQRILTQLVLLEQDDPEAPITIFINSPGGEVFSGFAIFDMLRFLSCPVTTIVGGFAASMGSILSLAANPWAQICLSQCENHDSPTPSHGLSRTRFRMSDPGSGDTQNKRPDH